VTSLLEIGHYKSLLDLGFRIVVLLQLQAWDIDARHVTNSKSEGMQFFHTLPPRTFT
jgi:hypothetical protein